MPARIKGYTDYFKKRSKTPNGDRDDKEEMEETIVPRDKPLSTKSKTPTDRGKTPAVRKSAFAANQPDPDPKKEARKVALKRRLLARRAGK